MDSTLIHCHRYRENEKGELVECGFDLRVSVESDMSGAERVAWANAREAALKAKVKK